MVSKLLFKGNPLSVQDRSPLQWLLFSDGQSDWPSLHLSPAKPRGKPLSPVSNPWLSETGEVRDIRKVCGAQCKTEGALQSSWVPTTAFLDTWDFGHGKNQTGGAWKCFLFFPESNLHGLYQAMSTEPQ